MKHIANLFGLFFSGGALFGYDLPPVNLGYTSFLDGGIRPAKPGFAVEEYAVYYHADKFENIGDHKSPNFEYYVLATQIVYTSSLKILGAKGGLNFVLPYVPYSHISKNELGLRDSGSGFANILTGAYLQWDPVMREGKPFFCTRLEFDFSPPTGKCHEPAVLINPGVAFWFIDPYWAATLFFTSKWSVSWRLHYLWSARDNKTHIKAGDATHINFTTEYALWDHFFVGVNGYFLQQLRNSRLNNQVIPNSRERVLGLGPGCLYSCSKSTALFFNYYVESCVRNRTRGQQVVLRLLKEF